MAFGDWTSRCGGKGWRTLPDGRIELAGEGVPTLDPNAPGMKPLALSYRNWERIARWASARAGVPVSWTVGFISAETGNWASDPAAQAGCGPWSTICHNACCAGPMQVMVTPYPNYRTFGGYASPDDMRDPWKAIDTGAKMLARMARNGDVGGELPALAATYNSGGVHCGADNEWGMRSDPGYVRRVVTFNNTAISVLGANTPRASLVASMGVGAGVAAAGLVLARWAGLF